MEPRKDRKIDWVALMWAGPVLIIGLGAVATGAYHHYLSSKPKPQPVAQAQVAQTKQTKQEPVVWRCSIEPTQEYGICLVIPAAMFKCPTDSTCCPWKWVPAGNGRFGCSVPICPGGMDCMLVKDYPGHVLTDVWPLADRLAAKDTEIATLRKDAVEYKHKTQDIWDNFAALQKENARLKKFEPPDGCFAQPAYCGPVFATSPAFGKDAEIARLRKENARLRKYTAPVNSTCLVTRMDNGAATECGTLSKDAAPPKEPQ